MDNPCISERHQRHVGDLVRISLGLRGRRRYITKYPRQRRGPSRDNKRWNHLGATERSSRSGHLIGVACVSELDCVSVGLNGEVFPDQSSIVESNLPPAPVVGMAANPSGGGYWIVNSQGGVTAYGDAGFFGSMSGQVLLPQSPTSSRHWTVRVTGAAGDGGIFAFGDAEFYGSTGGQRLNAPVVDMAPTPDGGGYWMVASDGGIFAFGDAQYSMGQLET